MSRAEPLLSDQANKYTEGGEGPDGPTASKWDNFKAKHPYCTKCCNKRFCKWFWGIALILFILLWIVQGITFYYATLGCGPRMLAKYDFPGGEEGPLGGSKTNLVPMISFLTQKTPHWGRSGFDNLPGNSMSNSPAGAQTGVWFRYWGPLFDTFVYMDSLNSKPTVYLRRNMLRIGTSYSIIRCDEMPEVENMTCRPKHRLIDEVNVSICEKGKEHFFDQVVITEGSYWLQNRFREFWHMQQGSSFKVYIDGEVAAIAQRVTSDVRSVTFRTADKSEKELASGTLVGRNWHGEKKDEWLVKNIASSTIPFYVIDAATVFFAFQVADDEAALSKAAAAKWKKDHPGGSKGNKDPNNNGWFLEQPEISFEPVALEGLGNETIAEKVAPEAKAVEVEANSEKAKPMAEPKAEPMAEPKEEPKAEPKAEAKVEANAEPEAEPKPAAQAEKVGEQPEQRQQTQQQGQQEARHWEKVGEKYEEAGQQEQEAGQQTEQGQQKQQVDYAKEYQKEGQKMEAKYAPHKESQKEGQKIEEKNAPHVV